MSPVPGRVSAPAQGSPVPSPALPAWPCLRCPLAVRWVPAEAEAGMARQGGPAPLFRACSFVCRSRSMAAPLPAREGTAGTGWLRGVGDAEQQVPVSLGCCCQPCQFPVLALPFLSLKLWFFSGQEEFEASRRAVACGQEQAGLCPRCPGWVTPGTAPSERPETAVGTPGCWRWFAGRGL